MGIEQPPPAPGGIPTEFYLEDGALYSPDNFADYCPGAAWTYSNVATGLAATWWKPLRAALCGICR